MRISMGGPPDHPDGFLLSFLSSSHCWGTDPTHRGTLTLPSAPVALRKTADVPFFCQWRSQRHSLWYSNLVIHEPHLEIQDHLLLSRAVDQEFSIASLTAIPGWLKTPLTAWFSSIPRPPICVPVPEWNAHALGQRSPPLPARWCWEGPGQTA